MTLKFPKGATVKYTDSWGPSGRTGTVVDQESGLVRFRGYNDGHDGDIENGSTEFWYCDNDELEVVSAPLALRDLKVGDRVRVINADGLAAKVGATATVTGFLALYGGGEDRFVEVAWDKNELAGTQFDGGYSPATFEKIEGEQASRFIVIKINQRGHYEPSLNPVVHLTREAAEQEAQRLAGKCHGQTFRVLELGKAFKSEVTVTVAEVA